jgi:hypothetical protein
MKKHVVKKHHRYNKTPFGHTMVFNIPHASALPAPEGPLDGTARISGQNQVSLTNGRQYAASARSTISARL